MYELVVLSIALLLAPVLAKHAGYERGGHLDLVGVGGLFLLLAAATHAPVFEIHGFFTTLGVYLGILAQGLGVMLLALGTLWGVMDVLFKTPAHIR